MLLTLLSCLGGPEAPDRLRLEYMQSPLLGVDTPYPPRLSWALRHTEPGQRQTAAEIALFRFTAAGFVAVVSVL